jgi:cyclopropane fatty-acyl-phospholipid synthase-like methyltransferase
MTGTIDWKEAWARSVGGTERVSTPGYWNSRAEDYSAMVKTSDCNHGRKILEYFLRQGILRRDWNVMDIASGPGAITIPFAEQVHQVTAVEPAQEMAARLMENARQHGLENIRVIPQAWQDVNVTDYAGAFDMVVCCHALWQFTDLISQVRRMETISRGYCCLAHGIEKSEQDLKKSVGLPVDDSPDQFFTAFNCLNDEGIGTNVNILDYSLMWPVDAAIASKERFVEKYRSLTPEDRFAIRSYIEKHTTGGIYRIPGRMGILWWKVER